jgi:hypothetical protein
MPQVAVFFLWCRQDRVEQRRKGRKEWAALTRLLLSIKALPSARASCRLKYLPALVSPPFGAPYPDG